MAVRAVGTSTKGTTDANAGTFAITAASIAAGNRVCVFAVVGNNVTQNSAVGTYAGGGGGSLTFTKIGDQFAFNNAGRIGIWLSDPVPSTGSTSITVTCSANNAHVQYIVREYANIGTGTALDISSGASNGQTGALVTSISVNTGQNPAIDDELKIAALFLDTNSPGTVSPGDGQVDLQAEASNGILYVQESILVDQNAGAPTNTTVWKNQCRSALIVLTLRGTYVAPTPVTAVPTTHALVGVGINFADDSFADNYAEAQTWNAYSNPIADPLVAPSVAAVGGGAFGAGTYYVAYTWADPTGTNKALSDGNNETAISPLAGPVTLTGGQSLQVTVPAPPKGFDPYVVTAANIYVSTATFIGGSGHQQGTITYPTLVGTFGAAYVSAGANSPANNQWQHKGGIGRKFEAARANYAIDSNLYPSGAGAFFNSFLLSSYRGGAYVLYQNGHPKTPLVGIDVSVSTSQPAWASGTVYAAGALVSYQIGGAGNPTYIFSSVNSGNVGNTPTLGTQNVGDANWLCTGTYAPNYAAGTTYAVGDCAVQNGERYVSMVGGNIGHTPANGDLGYGDGTYWKPYGTFWDSFAKGAYDVVTLTWFEEIRTSGLFGQGNPFNWCPAHEYSNNSDTTPNGPGAGTPAQYITYFQHARNLMNASYNTGVTGWAHAGTGQNYHRSQAGGCMALCIVPEVKMVGCDPNFGLTFTDVTATSVVDWSTIPTAANGVGSSASITVGSSTNWNTGGGYGLLDGRLFVYGGVSGTTLSPVWGVLSQATPGSIAKPINSGTTNVGSTITAAVVAMPGNGAYMTATTDPGSAYYDRVGADVYSHGTIDTADRQWPCLHNWAMARGKPIFVGEAGCDPASDNTIAHFARDYWIAVDAYVAAWGGGLGAGNIHAVCWTNRIASQGDYRFNAKPEILTQFQTMFAKAHWGGRTWTPYVASPQKLTLVPVST